MKRAFTTEARRHGENAGRWQRFKELPVGAKLIVIVLSPLALLWIAGFNLASLVDSIAHFWMAE